MADPTFPTALKPIVNAYSFGMGDNVLEQPVSGGSNLYIRDTKYTRTPFQVTIIMTPLKMAVFNDFYYGKINGGQDKFIMQLDSGTGIVDHVVNIEPSSIDQAFLNDPTRNVSFVVWAERTPFQDDPYEGNLADLYEEIGDDIPALLDALAIYVNEDMPAWLNPQ